MTKSYGEASALMREIRKDLSLTDKATTHATLMKLSTVISKSPDFRQSFIQTLDKFTVNSLEDMLAGYELSRVVPKTLVGRGMAMAALHGIQGGVSAAVLGVGWEAAALQAVHLAFNSPRLVGEALVLGSRIRKAASPYTKPLSEVGSVAVDVFANPAVRRPVTLSESVPSAEMP